jgi:aminopeptidase-like protein
MMRLITQLFPICRSITGDGLRASLRILQQTVPLEIHEVPTGTRAFDWTVPREWNIRDAWIKNSRGEKIVDFRSSNLHVLNYSIPIHAKMSLAELRPHLFTLPDHPEWIPYRTSYYQESWGYCLTQRQLEQLREDEYEVRIDSSLKDGHLTYGELYLPGESEDEVLFSCHACHPSLCNDNLSGMAVAAFLARRLSANSHRLSYRFLFIPGTIGSVTWLSRNEEKLASIKHGLVLSCLGDRGGFTYKRSRRGNAEIDQAVAHVLKHSGRAFQIADFSPYGYDERQFCSPGINLPVGRLTRTANGCYPQYHTSADNLDFVCPESLEDSLEQLVAIIQLLESNKTYLNLSPKCEPQLGKRGVYRAIGGVPDAGARELAMLWVLNLSDGSYSLLDIAERAALPFTAIASVAHSLLELGLLREIGRTGGVS